MFGFTLESTAYRLCSVYHIFILQLRKRLCDYTQNIVVSQLAWGSPVVAGQCSSIATKQLSQVCSPQEKLPYSAFRKSMTQKADVGTKLAIFRLRDRAIWPGAFNINSKNSATALRKLPLSALRKSKASNQIVARTFVNKYNLICFRWWIIVGVEVRHHNVLLIICQRYST